LLEFLSAKKYNIRKGGNKMKRFLFALATVFFINNVYAGDSAMDGKNVVLETNQGVIEVKLFTDIAPKTCENFIGLVKKGYYDGIIFHRVIKNFMIQGGDPTGTGRGGESIWGEPFEDEVASKVSFDKQGLLAMANAGPNTNGSQFFITTAATPWLNMKHTIFGEVVSGYDVVAKIENTAKDSSDKPLAEQKIIKAYLK
jgi:peptidylprolyl isomerase